MITPKKVFCSFSYFLPTILNFSTSAFKFSFFSSIFPFFLAPLFPVGHQKFPGEKCQEVLCGGPCPLLPLPACYATWSCPECLYSTQWRYIVGLHIINSTRSCYLFRDILLVCIEGGLSHNFFAPRQFQLIHAELRLVKKIRARRGLNPGQRCRSIFRRVISSEKFLFRKVYIPKGHYFEKFYPEGSLFRRYIPKGRYSEIQNKDPSG